MFLTLVLLALLLAALLVFQTCRALGPRRGTALGLGLVLSLGAAWGALEWTYRREPPSPEDQTTSRPVQSQACVKCHETHYTSWQHTYHRTMTREATPEFVKANFNNATVTYLGITSRLTRRGDHFFMETVDPAWEQQNVRRGVPRDKAGPPRFRVFSVDRLIGSHWFQQMLSCDENGRYLRLPLAYHLVEKRWVHINGAFVHPAETQTFSSRMAVWNETCVFCHNTRPSKNPVEPAAGRPGGYRTEVGELGIACEACHGAGERHVRAHQNPARRFAQRNSDEPDPTIVNPEKLSGAAADQVCAHCHGARTPRKNAWDPFTQADPFLAGRELSRFYYLLWSEAEQRLRERNQDAVPSPPPRPGPADGKFWGDGTPLTTGVEYQGMALSACYQNGHGKLRCISCHSMHESDPNQQLKEGMRTNAACYGCHEKYRERLTEHTHHAAGSSGSLCYNCHMPHQVYSLLSAKRSHRITVPRVRDSVSTGKPHACNLCHLDKSLGWTAEQLYKWYGTKPEPLPAEERELASSLLHLTKSDARSRAVVAAAFAWPPAQEASGRDWPCLLLTRTLETERYEAVRYSTYRALRSLCGAEAEAYDFQGSPEERAARLRILRELLQRRPRPDPGRYPYLPLNPAGLFADDVLERLLRHRNDPDVYINE
jgi:predicted CXXCH cytochrome family protein